MQWTFLKGRKLLLEPIETFLITKPLSHTPLKQSFVTATNANVGLNTIRDKFGYFFQNHINTLNLDGEWFHDITTETL